MSEQGTEPAQQSVATVLSGEATETNPASGETSGDTQITHEGSGEFSWDSHLEGDDLGLVQTKGYPDIPALVKAYRNATSKLGADPDRMLSLPVDMTDNEAMADVYAKLGRPESAEGYDFTVDTLDESDANWLKEQAHTAGLSNKQVASLAEQYAMRQTELSEQRLEQRQQQQDTETKEVLSEWGNEKENNLNRSKRGLTFLKDNGLPEDGVEALEAALGSRVALNLLAKLGSLTQEGSIVEGRGTGSLGLTPEAATHQLRELRASPEFSDQLFSDDKAVRDVARAKQQKLINAGATL
jgi:hypothetical protein